MRTNCKINSFLQNHAKFIQCHLFKIGFRIQITAPYFLIEVALSLLLTELSSLNVILPHCSFAAVLSLETYMIVLPEDTF